MMALRDGQGKMFETSEEPYIPLNHFTDKFIAYLERLHTRENL